MSFLQNILDSLRGRQRELVDWLRNAPSPERQLRLGPTPIEECDTGVSSLRSAIELAERNELGRCTVCHEIVDAHLLQMDYNASVCLDHFSREERSRLESELELAIKVQRALLPHATPSLPGWEIAAFSQPASVVGGDYFDFVPFGDGAQGVIIADVMGKGMPASMLMANLQASIRIIMPESSSPLEVVQKLNRLFRHNITLTKFVSLFVGHLDVSTGQLSYVNAGHNPPLVVTPGTGSAAGFTGLPPTGPAIGLVERPAFAVAHAAIPAGGALVLYTDGVVEARAGSDEEFGEARLKAAITAEGLVSAQETIRRVREHLQAFADGASLHDDTTLVVFRRLSMDAFSRPVSSP
ncbi:MAG TPA: PP2C family protein-serine/threonine phosphatase [Bacteroidota bacterium]|nr:PP2C family protein-serine/threonine phosphatase [Bacteroidota bacterium]